MSPKVKSSIKVAAVCLLAVLTVYLYPRYDNSFPYRVEIGKPWGYGLITAETDFPIYKTEAQLAAERQQLLRDFSPCYVPDSAAMVLPEVPVISLADYDRMREEGYSSIAVIINHVSRITPLSQVYTPKSAYVHFDREMSPNLYYDAAMTDKMRENLLAQISPTQGMVQQGEKIIDRGEIVSERDAQILYSYHQSMDDRALSHQQRLWRTVGESAIIVLFIALFVLYLYVFRLNLLRSLSATLFFCLLVAIIVFASCLLLRYTHWSLYLIPFAWVPVLTRVFYDSRTALFLHLTTVFMLALAVSAPFEFLVVQVAVGMVAVSSLRDMTQRAQLTRTAFWILFTYALTYTAVTLGATGDWHALEWHNYIYFLINAVLIVCAYGLIYLFERTFGLLSSITLVELADINSDLLHELAQRAPGTFQHSMQVSNLATEAAKEIGANALLVRTAALYHDIGKMQHPEYFTENQHGVNPLLQLTPQQAAKIIIAHVTDGERIAAQHHLPPMIARFILTHHGTSLTRYFYNTAVNDGMMVNPADFQYPGPKPSTKEGAILMMADAVEARSRSLTDISDQTISEVVDKMIDSQIADGQLSETPISFRDVERIREVFKQRLTTIYHHRIQYPELKQ